MPQDRTTQERAPLWEALATHVADRRARFHVPAHGGRSPALRQLLASGVRFDLTELGDLDDLHAPTGPIAEAEQLAADAIGADEAHFLVNGTSAGIEALLLASLRPGAKVLIGRDAHRAVVAGIILAGAEPEYIAPRLDSATGRSLGIAPDDVLAALSATPDAVACQLTNPNYYGVERDYAGVYQAARAVILVDEAHGAHHYFEGESAAGALVSGAAGTALSLHKSGLALTQSALVAVRGTGVDRRRLRAALQVLQSSSPSYLLMAGLDLGRRELATRGPELIAASRERRQRIADRIRRINGLTVWEPAAPGISAAHPLRLLVDVSRLGITGWDSADYLAARGVDVELADFTGILLALGYFGSAAEDARLISALRALTSDCRRAVGGAELPSDWAALYQVSHQRAMTPREAFFAPAEYVILREAAGRVAAEAISPYPPGIPLVVPGEVVTSEDCRLINAILKAGGRVQGVDPTGSISAVS